MLSFTVGRMRYTQICLSFIGRYIDEGDFCDCTIVRLPTQVCPGIYNANKS